MPATKERAYVYITQGCLDARNIVFKGIPECVAICPICHGNGKYVQSYMEGRMTGSCDFCKTTGFVYKNTSRGVPFSVTNQIAVATGVEVKRFDIYGLDWSGDPSVQCVLGKCASPELCNDFSDCDAKLLREGA